MGLLNRKEPLTNPELFWVMMAALILVSMATALLSVAFQAV